MPASFRRKQQNVWIAGNSRVRQRRKGDEWIILGVDDEGRDADLSQDANRACLGVVVICINKAMSPRGEMFIEVSNRAYKMNFCEVIQFRIESLFQVNPLSQPAQEILVIKPVGTTLYFLRAGAQID